jgi:hypothetical protein
MNYKAAGAPKFGTNAPKDGEHKGHGPRKARGVKRPSKEEMLARMKAAVEAKSKA